jgi:hypothetical protein
LVLTSLFVVFFGGQVFSGWLNYNQERTEHIDRSCPDRVFEKWVVWRSCLRNWESEFLQMGLCVILTAFLFQRGSAESESRPRGTADGSAAHDANVPLP